MEEKYVFNIPEFCRTHKICMGTFYNLKYQGKAPRLMKVGTRYMITAEAAAEWRKEREKDAAIEVAKQIAANGTTPHQERRLRATLEVAGALRENDTAA